MKLKGYPLHADLIIELWKNTTVGKNKKRATSFGTVGHENEIAN